MHKTVLMVAFHFPPFAGSSGVQRTLRFVQYLPQYLWRPIVLTVNQRAHEHIVSETENDVSEVIVKRAFALDSARHLAVKGRYFNWMAVPDRWITWLLGAVPSGLKLIGKYKPEIIWSTYPISTAHYIGWALHSFTRIPWVADFRDPMVEQNVRTGAWAPANKILRQSRLWIENKAVQNASRLIFCTQGAKNICMQRYPDADHSSWIVISNGFDESVFNEVEKRLDSKSHTHVEPKKIALLHSGMLYFSSDRDPSHFFRAIATLKKNDILDSKYFEIVLRASGFEAEYQVILDKLDISDIVKLKPAIAYAEALEEMMSIDGLLLFQGYTSNPAVPAKAYEYLRAKQPILSLVDSEGDTAALMKSVGMNFIAPLDDAALIEVKLQEFINAVKSNSFKKVDDNIISTYTRNNLTGQLSNILNDILAEAKKG